VERIRVAHCLCDAACRFYIDEGSFADARAPLRRRQPLAFVIDELRPEGKGLALQRLRRVDGTAVGFEEGAPHVARDAEAAQIFCAIDKAALEDRGFQVQEGGEAEDVVLSQVDEALLLATFYTAGLALESQVSIFARQGIRWRGFCRILITEAVSC
jgi:hypothetical protein